MSKLLFAGENIIHLSWWVLCTHDVSAPPPIDTSGILMAHISPKSPSNISPYCHTRPGGKTYPIPKGSKDGPKSGIIFISDQPASQPATHPASQPDSLTYQNFPTIGLEERPILSQRDRRMGRRVVSYSSVSQPASQPATQPATRTA